QTDELDQIHLQALARLAHRNQSGTYARDIAVMIGAQYVDQTLEAPVALLQVIRDVGSEVRLLAVLAHHHAVLLVSALGCPAPDGAILSIKPTLGLQARPRPVG